MAKTILRNLRINRVALCSRGANPHADIVLFKTLDKDPPSPKEQDDMKIDRKKLNKAEIQKLDALLDKMGVDSDEVAKFKKDKLPKPDQKALDTLIAKAAPKKDDDDKDDDDADETVGAAALLKAITDNPELVEELKANADIMKALGIDVHADDEEDEDDDADDDADDDIDVDEEITKALPKSAQALISKVMAGVKAQLRKAKNDAASARAEAAAAQKTANLEKEAREKATFTTAITPIIKSLPGEVVKNAELLFALKKTCSDKEFKQLETLLKAGNEAVANLFKETGVNGEGFLGNAYVQLDKLAKEYAKEKNVTYAKAFVAVCQQNRELQQEYEKEKPRVIG